MEGHLLICMFLGSLYEIENPRFRLWHLYQAKHEAASFLNSCTSSLPDGSTRPLQGARAIKGNGTILKEFHRLNCRREIRRSRNLWLYSGGKFLLGHFHLLLSDSHHICPVPSTLSILAAILATSSVSLSSPFSVHHNCSACLLPVSPSNLFLIFLPS